MSSKTIKNRFIFDRFVREETDDENNEGVDDDDDDDDAVWGRKSASSRVNCTHSVTPPNDIGFLFLEERPFVKLHLIVVSSADDDAASGRNSFPMYV